MKQPLEHLERFAADFSEKLLRPYIANIASLKPPIAAKEVNDAVWGTIALSPIEVLLVDSPLIQRLRYIRQIGVSHWVYPSAGHTRFEHTLGVLHQTRELIASLNHFSATSTKNGEVIKADDAHVLAMCAVMHDVSHGAFSHVSENALMNFEFYKRVTTSFAEETKGETNKLSEIFSFYVVKSPAFINLLTVIAEKVESFPRFSPSAKDNIRIIADKIGNAIVGLPISNQIPQLHELINGPFDADKLDYLNRDSKHSGVPTLVDISRLSQKLAIHKVEVEDIPQTIAEGIENSGAPIFLFGIRSSGAAVLDELHLGRTMLFNKIYRHQKIKALEAMVEAIFRVFGRIVPEDRLLDIAYGFGDDEILSLTKTTFSNSILARGLRPRKGSAPLIETACDLISRMKHRNLLVRSFVIQARYPSDPLADDENQRLGLQALVNDLSNAENVGDIKKLVVVELREIINLIDRTLFNSFPSDRLEHYLAVTPPNQPPGGTEIDRALLFPIGEKPTPYGDSIFATGNWSRFYAATDGAAGFVFAPKELSQFVYVACETVLGEKYRITIPKTCMELGKHVPSDLEELRKRLSSAGYFKGKGYYVRPYPSRLKKADIPPRINLVAAKLAVYQPPNTDTPPESSAPHASAE